MPLQGYPLSSKEQCLFQICTLYNPESIKDTILIDPSAGNCVNLYQNLVNWAENRLCLEYIDQEDVIYFKCKQEEIDKGIMIMCRLKLQKMMKYNLDTYNSFGFPVYLNFDADKQDCLQYDQRFETSGIHFMLLARFGNCPVLEIRLSCSLLLSHAFSHSILIIKYLYDILKNTENGNELLKSIINYIYEQSDDKLLFLYNLYKSNFELEDAVVKKRQFPWYTKLKQHFIFFNDISITKKKLITRAVFHAYKNKLFNRSIELAEEYCNYYGQLNDPTTLWLFFKMACSYDQLNRKEEACCIAVQIVLLLDYPNSILYLFKLLLNSGIMDCSSVQVPVINQPDLTSYQSNPLPILIKLTLLYSELPIHDDFNLYLKKYFCSSNNTLIRVNQLRLTKMTFFIKPEPCIVPNISINILIILQSHIVIDFDSIAIQVHDSLIEIKNVHFQGPCKQNLVLTGHCIKTGPIPVDKVICKLFNTELHFNCTPTTLLVENKVEKSPISLKFDRIPCSEPFTFSTTGFESFTLYSSYCNADKFECRIEDDLLLFNLLSRHPSQLTLSIVYGDSLSVFELKYNFQSVQALHCKLEFKFCADALFLLHFNNKSTHDIETKSEQQISDNSIIYAFNSNTLACIYEEIPSNLSFYWKSCSNTIWQHSNIPVVLENKCFTFIDCQGIIHPGIGFKVNYWIFNMTGQDIGPIDFTLKENNFVLVSGLRHFQETIKHRKLRCFSYTLMIEDTGIYPIPLLTDKIDFDAIFIHCIEK